VTGTIEPELLFNTGLLGLCYLYIIAIILIASKIKDRMPANFSRKFLHIMVGNFIFIIPFFTLRTFPLSFPFFVAAPFVLVTFLFSPLSPVNLSSKISGLAEITGGGHKFGLVFYAISYSFLALFFSAKPYIIAAGILPMAYGDAAASLVGQKLGRHKYNIFGAKSFEGSMAMFATCVSGLLACLLFFSYLYPISIFNFALASLGVAVVATACEGLTPRGFDNLTVPLCSAAVFLLLIGGV
jgi:dolichol kinase